MLHSEPGGLQVVVARPVAIVAGDPASTAGVPPGPRTLAREAMRMVSADATSPLTTPGRSTTPRWGASTLPSMLAAPVSSTRSPVSRTL